MRHWHVQKQHAENLLQRGRDAAHNVHAVLQDEEDENEDNDNDDSNDVILAVIGDEDETTNTATTRSGRVINERSEIDFFFVWFYIYNICYIIYIM